MIAYTGNKHQKKQLRKSSIVNKSSIKKMFTKKTMGEGSNLRSQASSVSSKMQAISDDKH